MVKAWKQPAPPKWLVRSRERIEASKPFKVGSDIHLLEMACAAYERAEAGLAFVAGHFTSVEGSREATEGTFGLDADEVVEMAHDNMIYRARDTLRGA